VSESAEHAESYLGGAKADVVVCALPYTSLEADLRRRLLDVLPSSVARSGTVLVIQYSPLMAGELGRRFGSVRRRISPRNVPPAFLFACTQPREV
jgi:phospholipid N-methyltransferase